MRRSKAGSRRENSGRTYADRYPDAWRDLQNEPAARAFLAKDRIENVDYFVRLLRCARGLDQGEQATPIETRLATAHEEAITKRTAMLERRRKLVVIAARALATRLQELGAAMKPIAQELERRTQERFDLAAPADAIARSIRLNIAARFEAAQLEGVPLDLCMIEGPETGFVASHLKSVGVIVEALTRWSEMHVAPRPKNGRRKGGSGSDFEMLVFLADVRELTPKQLAAIECLATGAFATKMLAAARQIKKWENIMKREGRAADWYFNGSRGRWDNTLQATVIDSRDELKVQFESRKESRRLRKFITVSRIK